MTHFGQSLSRALQITYPDFEWHLWRFHYVPKQFWKSQRNLEEYIHWLSKELHIEQLDHWYRVSIPQIDKIGGYSIIHNNGGLGVVLGKVYPKHHWDLVKIKSNIKKCHQRQLFITVKMIFPDMGEFFFFFHRDFYYFSEVLEDYSHPELSFTKSNQNMQLDIYIPKLRIAFEFQGIQHFEDRPIFAPQRIYAGEFFR